MRLLGEDCSSSVLMLTIVYLVTWEGFRSAINIVPTRHMSDHPHLGLRVRLLPFLPSLPNGSELSTQFKEVPRQSPLS